MSSTQGALAADPMARSFGVASYTVVGDTVHVLDQYGLELGAMKISTPSDGHRLIQLELAGGGTDEVEVHRPRADGTFFAPITPETTMTAAIADSALAPVFATYGITFHVTPVKQLAPALGTETVAETTQCTTGNGCTSSNRWTCSLDAAGHSGCVRSANLNQCFTNDGNHTACTCGTTGCVACDNVSQLPPTIYYNDPYAIIAIHEYYGTYEDCMAGITDFCDQTLGPGNYGSDGCVNSGDNPVEGDCYAHWTISQWIASCARWPANAGCGTAGQYDAVPRQDSCLDPGSCTFTQGNVSCTTYH